MTEATTTRDLLEIARVNAARAQQVLAKRELRHTRNAEMAKAAQQGQGVKQIAESFSVSQETVRSALRQQGVYTPQRRAKITDEVRAAIVDALRNGDSVASVAEVVGASAQSVRMIGLAAGVLTKGAPRKRRDEAEILLIRNFDSQARAQFNGQGLLALGNALRSHDRAAASKTSVGGTSPAVEATTPAPLPGADQPW
jgi:transposase